MDKTISFFWGNTTMSWLRYMTLWTFRKFNPDWKMRLFVCPQQRTDKYWKSPEQQDFHTYQGPDYSDRLGMIQGLQVIPWEVSDPDLMGLGPSHKSNFFKWELLANESGVYSDLDIVYVRPIDGWFERVQKGDVAICYHPKYFYFSIGLLGSSGKGEFYRRVYDESVKVDTVDYQGAGVAALFRLLGGVSARVWWKTLHQQFKGTEFVNFGMDYVYPWDSRYIPEYTEICNTTIPELTVGLHWYAGHASSQRLNAVLNPETVKTHQSTVAHFLRKIL